MVCTRDEHATGGPVQSCLSATPPCLGTQVLLSGFGAMRSNEQGLIAKVDFAVVTLVTVTSCTAVTEVLNICMCSKSELLLYPELLRILH